MNPQPEDVELEAGPCRCVAEHRPPVITFQRHHIVPKSWGGPDVATWNGKPQIVITCGTTHDSVHMLLNHWVRAHKAHVASGTTAPFAGPPTSITSMFTRYTQALARAGWANKPPGGPTPYTLADGTHPNQHQEAAMSDETVIQNQPDVTEAPTDGAVQVNEAENVTIQQGGQEQGNVAPGGQPTAADEAK